MKQTLTLVTLLSLFTLIGCKKEITEINEPYNDESNANRGPATVSLNVSFRELASDKILTDGLGTYSNGKDRVEASIQSSDGNFYMNTNNNTSKAPIRNLRFELNNPPILMNNQKNYSLRTSAPADPGINGGSTYWMQEMPVGHSQLMGFRAWGFQQGGFISWKLNYRNGVDNTVTSNTDYARVSRISSTEWWIEPANYPGVNSASANLRDGNANMLGAGFTVPFKLVLKKLVR